MVLHLHTGGKYQQKKESYQWMNIRLSSTVVSTKFLDTEAYRCHEIKNAQCLIALKMLFFLKDTISQKKKKWRLH